ncbi:3-oxoacyl-[acyl-carrier-protein] reductase FabG [Roseivivax sp. THAF40]|uniref:SDR family NAD(P)-dependent oxidoreductase n=1 Tax=unclassified Roseivivax TaxID=2639302 RepID=UPI0012690928|nr:MULTISPECIES: SDR family oxidoreductase [unclassified Roseivivax]QFS81566.1 3-oxoacyl-[acyl-carrier-protein] reductase FabG [Roseivivax sp. THAF197b]QFT45295.1 3-oxoacyl-[acyl-carrier-protein] reductase FabG [Roseivivax sp. THAF40]
MSFSIEGKTAIVTGAANGVGLAIARHFAAKGANVMFADIDESRLAEEVGDSDTSETMRYFAGDLREKLTLANLLSATLDAFDRVDILVNGSRQMIETDPMSMDDMSVETLLNQNLMTALRLSQLVARRMIKQGKDQEDGQLGAIVNLSSIAARRTHPQLMGYSVSCAALDQMTRSMAVALAPKRIRVNALAFGSVMSTSLKDTLKEHREYRGNIEEHTPLGRIAAAEELAEAVQFLCSDSAKFLTGQIMTVDGGRTLLDPVNAPAH